MRIVIVGAGLSGLSLAAFLRRLNIDCVVLEQAPFLSANYQLPVTLYANALSCYKAFGFDTFFETRTLIPEDFFGVRDEKGKWLLKVKNSDVNLNSLTEEDIIPLSTAPMARSESIVSRALAEEARVEMGHVPLRATFPASRLKHMLRQFTPEIRYGCRVVDLVPHDGIKGGVHAVLHDGSTEWGDVVVGADGMHSTIRKLLYPAESVSTSSTSLNMTTIDGFTDVGAVPDSLGEHPCELWGHRKTIAYLPLFNHGERRIGFSATLYDSPQELVSLNAGAMEGAELRDAFRGVMTKEFATFPPELVQILKQADVALATEQLEVPIMPRWYNRRAVLVGEAAHGAIPSFLGQDSSLCVEDAALLASALVETPLNTDKGFEFVFKTYEVTRRNRIEKYVRQSRRARRFTSTSYCSARNAALQLTPPFVMKQAQRWLSQWTYSSQLLEVDPRLKAELRYRM